MFKISTEELERVLSDFYNVTKFKIVLFDSDRRVICSYPVGMCSFCSEVRSSPELREKCLGCDNVGFDICDKTRAPYIYKCHLSVIEAIAPIYSEDINMGYLMFGQILPTDHSDILKKAEEISRLYGISLTEDKLNEMTTASESYINSAVNMMSMCANYLYTKEIIKNDTGIFIYRLKEYIDAHLDTELSVFALCHHFYISRSKLYKISSSEFGMGISDYIAKRRLFRAKELLAKTDLPVYDISFAVGICDTNYFIRFFKKNEGVTPLGYRKNIKIK